MALIRHTTDPLLKRVCEVVRKDQSFKERFALLERKILDEPSSNWTRIWSEIYGLIIGASMKSKDLTMRWCMACNEMTHTIIVDLKKRKLGAR
jgi:hypothetical protein